MTLTAVALRIMRSPKDFTSSHGPRLGEVLDAIQDLVATFDHEGRLLVLNAAGRLLLGLPLDEALSDWLLSDLLPEDEAERFVGEVLPAAISNGEWFGRAELRGSRGASLPVALRMIAHPPRTDAVRGFTLVARDAAAPTPRRDTGSDDADVDLLLQVLHDVNNLLGPILAHAELAAEELSPMSSAGRRLALIEQAAESARDLCRRAAERRRSRSAWRVVDLADLAREVVGWLRAEFPRASIGLTLRSVRVEVFGDVRELERVLVNLCRNAAESLPEGRGSMRLALSLRPEVQRVRLTVSDEGCGIERDRLETIFEPFRSSKGEGRGLGLALAREIVRGHGGSLDIESAPGVGTQVHVELPLHSSSATA